MLNVYILNSSYNVTVLQFTKKKRIVIFLKVLSAFLYFFTFLCLEHKIYRTINII